jgi:alkyl hydroperoxide reductase subunit AhpF
MPTAITPCTTLAAALALLLALAVAASWSVTGADECTSAERAINALIHSLAESPQAAAASLSGAFATQNGKASSLLPTRLRPQGRCEQFEASAAPLLRFLAKLHSSVQAPALQLQQRRGSRSSQRMRILVVGAGPAGLPAALVAHREGAHVTVVEQRTSRTR